MGIPKRLLTHRATIYRKEKVTGKGVSSQYVKKYENLPCLVIPQTNRYSLSKDFIYGQDYIGMFDVGIDVKKGDKIVVSNGVTVYAGGTGVYKDVPKVAHVEVACSTEGV